MSDYDNTNRGAIWKNARKETDNHPDFKGEMNVEGKDYWVSAWKRGPEDPSNRPALRFSVTAKEQPATAPAKPAAAAGSFDDDIPF